ncbi:carbon-nitrogen hydrolase family protein [Flavobacteriaceae bacterium F89]|uniref:Carbon-nitrogen hydrolase family protein n=1 Tax=Cerina litoralis TaxID=2874477 RepID=A0AAE3EYI4_9FLAO|nr:carbon-nitrogen hydrolase family protein [Cerina litoralis]MCG2462086.1 carbon-nitrogen hydrolase family protein [Cerina litoralis]
MKVIINRLKCYLPIAMMFVLIFQTNTAQAENKVTIATIGGSPTINKNQAPEEQVKQMINFWRGQLMQVLYSKVDLIVLTEVSDVPEGQNAVERMQYLKVRQNRLLDYFASVAKDNNCYIAFGSIRETNDGLRNSLILLDRKGKVVGIYNKNFPTIPEMDEGIKPGSEISIIQCDFGKVALAICFDLNFDELREQYAKEKPDIVLFSSVYHGGLMQGIWAYSCRSYFVGAIGSSENPSEILNPLGEVVATSTNYFNYTKATINLDYKLVHLDFNWAKLTMLKAKYGNAVTIHDPGRVGAVMITSEDKNISASQMVQEFDIELLDDYFNRSRAVRSKHIIMN